MTRHSLKYWFYRATLPFRLRKQRIIRRARAEAAYRGMAKRKARGAVHG